MFKLIKKFFSNYFNFSGKTTVKEFWLTFLSLLVFEFLLWILFAVCTAGAAGAGSTVLGALATLLIVLLVLFGLAIFIPCLAMWCRRLRDGGFSPWLILIALIPGIGGLILFILSFMPSK